MKNKIVAAMLALFFGVLGVHRFYLGRRFWGIAHLVLFFITLTATIDHEGPFIIAPAILGFIDAILLFAMPVEDFDERYNAKRMRKQKRVREEWVDYEAEAPARNTGRQGSTQYSESFLKKLGIDKFRSGDFLGAIDAFREGLEQSAESPVLHYNLACCFSMLHDAPSGFEHLEKAVQRGFSELDKIHQHAALHYLRTQPEFEQFVRNGYKRKPERSSPVSAKVESTPASNAAAPDAPEVVIDELFQLGQLMDKGLISEDEFLREKKKLLSE